MYERRGKALKRTWVKSMLPRFGQLDLLFGQADQEYMRRISRRGVVMNEIKSHVIHEGREAAIQRSIGDRESIKMQKGEAEILMTFEEIEEISLDFVLRKAHEASEQFARQFSTFLLETLNAVTDKTGLKVDGLACCRFRRHRVKVS
jgi:hypothetical protein